ncbi:hypothetical protein NBE98_03430 [Clostridium swellfunianum]|uniref:hypothetical protein n=1 Tax=Clostridium swellfunianum TaxID=1367462 RepID=UPI00202E1D6F|nr:hypothetical protein [Clostridium swellfunianum]MCM0647428.1 hypothetical protein [Clostridium swellfunianum]
MATNTSVKNHLRKRHAAAKSLIELEIPKAAEAVQTTFDTNIEKPYLQPIIKTSILREEKGYSIILDVTINLKA